MRSSSSFVQKAASSPGFTSLFAVKFLPRCIHCVLHSLKLFSPVVKTSTETVDTFGEFYFYFFRKQIYRENSFTSISIFFEQENYTKMTSF